MEVPDGGPFRLDPIPFRSPAALRANVTEALSRPVGAPSLGEIFRGARRVLVVVSDATRATGCAEFLPALVDRIHASCRASVTFIVASGIHRRPTNGEIEAILGPDIASRYPAIRHDPDDSGRLVPLGRTRSGTPVLVNSAVVEHDRVVLTGTAGFHYYAGFTGGRKALVPGLAARETIGRNHLRALSPSGERHPGARAGRLQDNPVHRDMAEGAALVGPHLLVNSVIDETGRIERMFVGHWRRAHETACRYLRSTRHVEVEPRDLVVASAGGEPHDINLIQSHKTLEAVLGAVRPGGVIILLASCREGAGHPDFLHAFEHPGEAELVRALRADFKVYGQTALSWIRKATRYRLILVSALEGDLVRKLGAEPAEDLEAALRAARRHVRSGTRGWLVTQGSRLLLAAGTPSARFA